jgi:hypothetical protein
MGDFEIKPLTPTTWEAFAALAQKHNGVWGAGGGVVQGYPRDTQGKKMSASFLYNGTRSQFEKAGFEFVRSKGKCNCVMRTTVEPV